MAGKTCKKRWKGCRRGLNTKNAKYRIITSLQKRGKWSLKKFAKIVKS